MRLDALDRSLSPWPRAAGIASLYAPVTAAGRCAGRQRLDSVFL